MPQVYILSGCRTAIGKFQGQFNNVSASDLGAVVISEAIARAALKPEDVDQVILGQVLTAGQGQNPARQAAVAANLPYSCPAYIVNMLCGSGLKSVALGFQAIKNDDCEIIVAGGQENMSRAQHATFARKAKMGHIELSDTLLSDGLIDPFNKIHMGATAEHLAKVFNISREEQDNFALNSQLKTEEAIKNGFFEKEIVGVASPPAGIVFDKDEYPRRGTTIEALGKLKPCFDKNGTVTAGNASGINDGAAAVLLASESQVQSRNLAPLAKIISFAEVGIEPICMGAGPIRAVKLALKKANWTIDEVDLFELNEAFAVQSVVVNKELGVDESKVNVTGGAIALGHPIGSSGTRILVTLLHNLKRLGKRKGVAALCIGGGMGIAMTIEMC